MAEYDVIIAGAGLAGSEAAYQLAESGYKVNLIEMRPLKTTPAHETDKFAELVCSNSLKSLDITTGSGLLKKEMMLYNSFLMQTALKCSVPAGGALAVDRVLFSNIITNSLKNHKNITVTNKEITELPINTDTPFLIATGPLTSDILAEHIKEYCGGALYFADAISPIIDADTVDMEKGYFLGRYGKGGDDYFNIPLTEEDYNILEDTKNSNRIIIGNKLDITDNKSYDKADIYISAKTGINIDELLEILREKTSLYDNEIKSNAAAITERHHNILINIKEIIEKINLSLGIYPIDMLCIDLERAINLLSEITGDNYTEKVLDIVFSSFCIGK